MSQKIFIYKECLHMMLELQLAIIIIIIIIIIYIRIDYYFILIIAIKSLIPCDILTQIFVLKCMQWLYCLQIDLIR